jgi:hypothetical protein
MLHASLPGHPEPSGLLALMLLTDARRPARTGPHDELIPLSKQGRQLWAPYVMPVVRAAWSQPIQPRSLPVSLGGFNQIGRIPRNRDRPDLSSVPLICRGNAMAAVTRRAAPATRPG